MIKKKTARRTFLTLLSAFCFEFFIPHQGIRVGVGFVASKMWSGVIVDNGQARLSNDEYCSGFGEKSIFFSRQNIDTFIYWRNQRHFEFSDFGKKMKRNFNFLIFFSFDTFLTYIIYILYFSMLKVKKCVTLRKLIHRDTFLCVDVEVEICWEL